MTAVVVTGSTRGIGRGLAEALLDRGASVAIAGRTPATVEAVVSELAEQHGSDRVAGQACDVRDIAQLEKLWNVAAESFGRIDIWINNAGVSARRVPLWELEADEIDVVLDTNLRASIHATRLAIERMSSQGGGVVYNMEGFGSGGQLADGISVYGATKRAVTYFSKAVTKDLDGGAVHVGLLSPGIVATDLLLADYEGQHEKLERATRIFNILGDTVDTVAPFLADQVLRDPTTARHIQWLTRRKAFGRFATAAFRKRSII